MRRRAFLIGENGPANDFLKPLAFAEQDAVRLGRVLSSPTLGYDVVVSTGRHAFDHLDDLDAFASDCRRDDILLVYFSGHGYLPRTGLYFLCGSSNFARKLVTTTIPLATVRSILENCASQTKMLILDCCHSGAAATDIWGTKKTQDSPGNRLDAETRDSASLVIAASERFSSAREASELGGGIMTSFLLDALSNPERSDKDRDGRLSVADVMEWLRARSREFNATVGPDGQVDIPILYGDMRGDVFLTPELGTTDEAQALAGIRNAVDEVRAVFARDSRLDTRTLEKLARPIAVRAPTLTSTRIVDELLDTKDDASVWCAAIIIYEKRLTRYAYALVSLLTLRLRSAALWRTLRALRRITRPGSLDAGTLDLLRTNLRAIVLASRRFEDEGFGPNSVFGKIISLLEHLRISPHSIFTPEQLRKRVPIGSDGKPRQWSGKIRLYYEGRDWRISASSYTQFVDFIDEVYERLRQEGSLISAYTYGIDWALKAGGVQLPAVPQANQTTLLDLGLRDDERVEFVQLAGDHAISSHSEAIRGPRKE